jgi:hypothetical protein
VTTLVVGTDEAGYGPNLGPLVIGATAWEAAAAPGDVEPLFAAAAADLAGVWGDSKVIHRGGGGFAALERGALVAASAGGEAPPATWSALLAAVHDPDYVRQVLDARVPPKVERVIGLPITRSVVERTQAAVGGTVTNDAVGTRSCRAQPCDGLTLACRRTGPDPYQ